jgi:pimeloyl-ACP methyl ester carboxylesterase
VFYRCGRAKHGFSKTVKQAEVLLMKCIIRGIPIHYEEYGEGLPVIFIHGGWVDHRLMSESFEPVFRQTEGYRRIYPDLPGMGMTPSAKWIKTSNHMIELLTDFINTVIGDDEFLLAGESYGGYLSLGLIHEMTERINGVLLLCPQVDAWEVVNQPDKLPVKKIVHREELTGTPEDIEAFLEMAVMAVPEVFNKYRKDILSGINIADREFLLNDFSWAYSTEYQDAVRTVQFDKPTCIICGRQDHIVGYSCAYDLLDRFPRAAFAVLDCAGHNLQIDNEKTFQQLVKDWIWRVGLN